MKFLGYIGIGSTLVLLNIWKVNNAGIDYFDVCMAAILTTWVMIAGISMVGGIVFNLSQSFSVLWLGIGLLFDLFQEALNINTGSSLWEIIIFSLGFIAIHLFFNPTPRYNDNSK